MVNKLLSNEELFTIAEFVKIILSSIVPLVVVTGAYAIYLDKAKNRGSKNRYMDLLKMNGSIKKALIDIKFVGTFRIILSFFLSVFVLIGIVYSTIGSVIILAFLQSVYQSNFRYKSQLFLNMDPDVAISADFIVGTYLNIMIVILLVVAFLLYRQKNILSVTENMEPDRKSHVLLYAYSFVGGLIIGTNYFIYYSLYDIFKKHIVVSDFELSLNYLLDLYALIQGILPAQWDFLSTIYLFSIVFSIIALSLVYRKATVLLTEWKKQIMIHHSDNFPYVYIKMNSGIIYGKIEDMLNENIILINENGVVKAIFWKNIEAIEMADSTNVQSKSTYEATYIW